MLKNAAESSSLSRSRSSACFLSVMSCMAPKPPTILPVASNSSRACSSNPFRFVVNNDAVLNVVGSACDSSLPASIDVLLVLGMDSGKEAFIGQWRLRRDPEHAEGLGRPDERIAVHIEPPATGAGHGLRAVQILPAFPQRPLHLDTGGNVLAENQDSADGPICAAPGLHLPSAPLQAPVGARKRVRSSRMVSPESAR